MRLLALDFGADTGWALWDDGVVSSGIWHLNKSSQSRFEGGGMKFVRFLRLLKELPVPDRVAFEEVRRHLGVNAAHAYGGYLSHLQSWCESNKSAIPYEGIPVATIKKRATGKGNASKEEMIEAAQKLLKVNPGNDDEADALWILLLLAEAEGLSWPGGPVQQLTFDKKSIKKK